MRLAHLLFFNDEDVIFACKKCENSECSFHEERQAMINKRESAK